MIQKKIAAFYQNYYENEKKMEEADNRLFEAADSSEEWIERLRNRSEVIRKAYEQNMDGIENVLMSIIRHQIYL